MPVTVNSFSRPDYTGIYAGGPASNTQLAVTVPSYNKESGDCWVIVAISGTCGWLGQYYGNYYGGSPIPVLPMYGRNSFEYFPLDWYLLSYIDPGGYYGFGYDITLTPTTPIQINNANRTTFDPFGSSQLWIADDRGNGNGGGLFCPRPIGIAPRGDYSQENFRVSFIRTDSQRTGYNETYAADLWMGHIAWKNPPTGSYYVQWTDAGLSSSLLYNYGQLYEVHGAWVVTGVKKSYVNNFDFRDYWSNATGPLAGTYMDIFNFSDYSIVLPFSVNYEMVYATLSNNETLTHTTTHGSSYIGGQVLAHTIALGPITPNPTATGESNYQAINSEQYVTTYIDDPLGVGWAPSLHSSWSTKSITSSSTTINRTRTSWGPFTGLAADEPGIDNVPYIFSSVAIQPHNGGSFSGVVIKNEYETTTRADRKIFPVQSRRPYMYTKKITDLTKSRQIPDHWA